MPNEWRIAARLFLTVALVDGEDVYSIVLGAALFACRAQRWRQECLLEDGSAQLFFCCRVRGRRQECLPEVYLQVIEGWRAGESAWLFPRSVAPSVFVMFVFMFVYLTWLPEMFG